MLSVWKRRPGERRERYARRHARRAIARTCASTRSARARISRPFLQHAGVPTLNVGFGGEDGGGIYHSIYDSFYWYTHFSDTSFVYGRALAQTVGMAVMRLADADVLPFAFTNLAETARGYAKELEQLRDHRAADILERNRQIDDGVFAATNDPRSPTASPGKARPRPHFNFAEAHCSTRSTHSIMLPNATRGHTPPGVIGGQGRYSRK